MQKIFDTMGQPRNYGPSSQEVQEEERRKTEQRMRREAQEKAEEEQREAEEAEQRAARWEEWVRTGGLDYQTHLEIDAVFPLYCVSVGALLLKHESQLIPTEPCYSEH